MSPCQEATILIVDDQESSIMLLEEAVEKLGMVISTTDPDQVLSLVIAHQPDVILMDIDLGTHNGINIGKDILANEYLPDPAIVFVTSCEDTDIEYHSLYSGGVDFITKPINFDICRIRVSNQIKMKTFANQVEAARRAIYKEKEHLKVTLNSIGDAVLVTDTKGIVTFANPIAEKLTGIHANKLKGQHIEKVLNLKDASSGETSPNPAALALKERRIVGMALNCQLTNYQGQVFRVEDSAAPMFDNAGSLIGAVMVFRDISESVSMSVKMNDLANNDHLTGLPNRILLHDRIGQALRFSHSKNESVALLLIDLDHFKYLNEAIGHHNGDVLIKLVANRILNLLDERYTLSRVGGDEFAIVMPELTSPSTAGFLASDILHSMKTPFLLNHQEHTISVSIGISISPADAMNEETLMRHADTAMFRAKKQGRNNLCYFSDALEEELLCRIEVEKALRKAIDSNSVEVRFQPQIDLKTSEIIAVEALARIKDDAGNFISPLKFIALAEELNLMDRLDHKIFTKACIAYTNWCTLGAQFKLCLNVSAKQFSTKSFVDTILGVAEQHKIHTSNIVLEITEKALMADFEQVKRNINRLSKAKFSIAIDDFGTGYSSLSYLKFFNVNILKIDQSFVQDMLEDEQSGDIVQTIINLGQTLNLQVVAEGIETQAHEDKLKLMSCSIGQGNLYGKPLSEKDLGKYLSHKTHIEDVKTT